MVMSQLYPMDRKPTPGSLCKNSQSKNTGVEFVMPLPGSSDLKSDPHLLCLLCEWVLIH